MSDVLPRQAEDGSAEFGEFGTCLSHGWGRRMLPCDCGVERGSRNARFKRGRDDNEAIGIADGGVTSEWGSLRGAGCGTGWAGGESGDGDGQESIDALRKKYGGGRGFDACGEI